MLLEQKRYYGLTVCSGNTNVISVWAWVLWSPRAFGTRTFSWFGHGCSGQRMLLEHTNAIMVWAWVLQCRYALGTRTLLWFGHGCSSDRMLLEHDRYYGLGMDALIIECSATRMSLWFGHGCYSDRMLLEHKRYYGLGVDATKTVCSWNTNLGTRTLYGLGNTLYGLGNGCSGQRMLLKHERSLWFRHGCSGHRVPPDTNVIIVWGLSDRNAIMVWGIDALVTVCSSNTNVLMVWAWVLWSQCALGTRMFS